MLLLLALVVPLGLMLLLCVFIDVRNRRRGRRSIHVDSRAQIVARGKDGQYGPPPSRAGEAGPIIGS